MKGWKELFELVPFLLSFTKYLFYSKILLKSYSLQNSHHMLVCTI